MNLSKTSLQKLQWPYPLLTRNWTLVLFLAWVLGILLRVLFVQDMEYKEDEEYNFTQSQLIGSSQPWPWYGIPSGVYLVNPGMSIWVFAALAKLFGIHQPTSLAHAVQLFAILGMSLIIPFALTFFRDQPEERNSWLWAFLLAMVNPFLILYQRKLWPEPFLPFFTLLTLMGWWTRTRSWSAFIWGMIGAWLGQIHMSGFFFSGALFLWTVLFDRNRSKIAWKSWLVGSVVGALPLIPWLIYLWQHPISQSMGGGWNEIIQLKYWAFWITDPLGLHLGNPLGILRGNSHWSQISDFVRYPIIFGQATYLTGIAHLSTALCAVAIFSQGISSLWKKRGIGSKNCLHTWIGIWTGNDSPTSFALNATLWGCGILLTLTGVMIRRYYMAVTFPFEFLFLVRMARPSTPLGRTLLTLLWVSEFFISANFVGYIHVNEGSIQGDYGKAYHLVHPPAGD